MKKKTTAKPTSGKFSLLRQICNFIPPHLVPKLAHDTGVEKQWRDFTLWSHVVCLFYAQLTHRLDLNARYWPTVKNLTKRNLTFFLLLNSLRSRKQQF